MAYNDPKTIETRDTYVERDPAVRSTGSTGVGLAIGGLIVAVLVLFWLFGGDNQPATNTSGETPVIIDDTANPTVAPEAEQSAPVQTAPEAAPETAPAAPTDETAPVDPAATGGTQTD